MENVIDKMLTLMSKIMFQECLHSDRLFDRKEKKLKPRSRSKMVSSQSSPSTKGKTHFMAVVVEELKSNRIQDESNILPKKRMKRLRPSSSK